MVDKLRRFVPDLTKQCAHAHILVEEGSDIALRCSDP